nr:unnamed protein product [Digitaria exilis]CAB3456383.1 unnamed protein product [Digitaria exilis]
MRHAAARATAGGLGSGATAYTLSFTRHTLRRSHANLPTPPAGGHRGSTTARSGARRLVGGPPPLNTHDLFYGRPG